MMRPLLAGSALNRDSWASPTLSKANPNTHSATPANATHWRGCWVCTASWSGIEMSQTSAPWSKYTHRRAYRCGLPGAFESMRS